MGLSCLVFVGLSLPTWERYPKALSLGVERFLDKSGYFFYMKDSEFDCKINGVPLSFYHNTKTHQYEVVVDYNVQEPYVMTKAKGEALIQFLKDNFQSQGT